MQSSLGWDVHFLENSTTLGIEFLFRFGFAVLGTEPRARSRLDQLLPLIQALVPLVVFQRQGSAGGLSWPRVGELTRVATRWQQVLTDSQDRWFGFAVPAEGGK